MYPGHDHAQRRAVDERERLAVHRPSKQDFGARCLIERDRATEALYGPRLRADVGAVEANVRRLPQRPGEREHVGKRDPTPRRRAGRARTPRRLARNLADRGQTRTPVTRALQCRGHLPYLKRLAQRGQRQG